MDNALGYPSEVWQLFRHTPRSGAVDPGLPGVCTGEARSATGNMRLRLSVRADSGRVMDARFQAHGCPYTIAAAAWLARWLVDRPWEDLKNPPTTELRAALEIPEDRAHCWLMAQDVLRDLYNRSSI